MTKIYRTIDNDYVALVAHCRDLSDDRGMYSGLFEYSIRQDVDSGKWDLDIFDLGEGGSLDIGHLSGVSWEDVLRLFEASIGALPYEDITDGDYYTRIERFNEIVSDGVLMKAIAAEYTERD